MLLPQLWIPCMSACGDHSLAVVYRRQLLPAPPAQAQAQPLQWQLQWPRPAQPSPPAVGRHQQLPQVQCCIIAFNKAKAIWPQTLLAAKFLPWPDLPWLSANEALLRIVAAAAGKA